MLKSTSFLGAVCLACAATAAQATLYGPSPYSSSADSPFSPFTGYSYFYLEDFEDGAFNVPGVSAVGDGLCVDGPGGCFAGTGLIDSVENGQQGHAHFAFGSITYTFDAGVLGALPSDVGIVWTDGSNPITFQAFDASNALIGTLVGNHADGSNSGTTAEDRFYGVRNAGGVSRIVIGNPSGIELDHLQYGLATAVPEPATCAVLLAGLTLLGFARRSRAMLQFKT